jgi:ribonuclease HI
MAAAYTLVTDGACSGNGTEDARGGWAAILTAPDGAETVLTGGEYPTTNNRMELMAALEGLRSLPEGSDVELVTDSSYLANAISKGWLDGWQRKGWRTASRQPVANRDLWEPLIDGFEAGRFGVPRWVKGHSGDPMNDLVDALAVEACQSRVGASGPA